jgi:hypothetical protein
LRIQRPLMFCVKATRQQWAVRLRGHSISASRVGRAQEVSRLSGREVETYLMTKRAMQRNDVPTPKKQEIKNNPHNAKGT